MNTDFAVEFSSFTPAFMHAGSRRHDGRSRIVAATLLASAR
jgi:hypothetical protein